MTLEQLHAQIQRLATGQVQQDELKKTAQEMQAFAQKLVSQRLGGTGKLRASLEARVEGASIHMGSSLRYARIQEEGGMILPKKGKYLMIPQPGGGFRRVEKVTLKGRHFLRDARIWGENRLRERLEKRMTEVLSGK
jgi:hypothetical protein